ncbi:MAG: nucleotidyltransferase family protein [Alphaproteobacteria bacterium]|nr:nucleotidyltransferase family protein [Alphaproteobacteria bacterium]
MSPNTAKTPNKAFILAAGLGSRLRPYTNNTPKPLVTVNNKTLLDRTLDHLHVAGINEIALNTHYLPDQINACISARPEFKSHTTFEENLLDTGGGIKNMLQHFDDAFYVLSGDGLWDNAQNPAQQNTLNAMRDTWDDETMDILILLQPVASMTLTHGVGDYTLSENGLPIRSLDKSGEYMFTSMRINHPRIFDDAPDDAFSYLTLMDKAEAEGRLHAIIHHGEWHHISTPKDLEAVDAAYKQIDLSET